MRLTDYRCKTRQHTPESRKKIQASVKATIERKRMEKAQAEKNKSKDPNDDGAK